MKKDFTTLTIVLIVVAIAINIVIGQLVKILSLPVYLDSVGTILVGLLAGPWAGMLTGFLSNLIWALISAPITAPFAVVAAIIGLLAGIFGSLGWFKKWYLWLLGGLITGIVAALLSAPISAYLFGGVMGGGTDILVAFFRAAGASVLKASLGQGIVSDPLDKVVSYLVVFLIAQALPHRFLSRFPRAENVLAEEDAFQA